jgi:hypothetical protein
MMMNIGSLIKVRNSGSAPSNDTGGDGDHSWECCAERIDQEGCPRQMMSITITVFCLPTWRPELYPIQRVTADQ